MQPASEWGLCVDTVMQRPGTSMLYMLPRGAILPDYVGTS
jgi:hypothetical protein